VDGYQDGHTEAAATAAGLGQARRPPLISVVMGGHSWAYREQATWNCSTTASATSTPPACSAAPAPCRPPRSTRGADLEVGVAAGPVYLALRPAERASCRSAQVGGKLIAPLAPARNSRGTILLAGKPLKTVAAGSVKDVPAGAVSGIA